MLDEIIVGVQGVRKKVKNINEKQDEINEKVDGGNKEARKLEDRLQTDNQKLKKVLDDMKPNRCCLAIFLLLLLIGLVVVIIKFLIPQEGESTDTTTNWFNVQDDCIEILDWNQSAWVFFYFFFRMYISWLWISFMVSIYFLYLSSILQVLLLYCYIVRLASSRLA